MTYINIAIILLIVLFDLIVLKFVWIILTSRNVTQLEAAVTSFALIACAVVMTFTSAVTVVYADESRMETKYINGKTYRVPNRTYNLWNGGTTYHSRYSNKYHNKGRLHSTSKHARPKLIHKPVKR